MILGAVIVIGLVMIIEIDVVIFVVRAIGIVLIIIRRWLVWA